MVKIKKSLLLSECEHTEPAHIHGASRAMTRPRSESFEYGREKQSESYERIGDGPDTRALPRVFDMKLGCFVLAQPRIDKSRLGKRRARRDTVDIRDGSGVWWWIGDKVSGCRVRKIEAMDHHSAVNEALRLYPKMKRHELTICKAAD